jgi:hypothetical protein
LLLPFLAKAALGMFLGRCRGIFALPNPSP